MPGNDSTIKILVRKSDGTSVYMTMEEFVAYKTGNVKKDLPLVENDILPAVSAPVKDVFVNEAEALLRGQQKDVESKKKDVKKWTVEDTVSPLEEKEIKVKKPEIVQTILPNSRDESLAWVLSNLKFKIKDNLLGRARSLLISYVKDIRTDEQILEYAMLEEGKGGLGLSEENANDFLSAIKKITSQPRIEINEVGKNNTLAIDNINTKITSYGGAVVGQKIQPNYGMRPREVIHDITPPKQEKISLTPIEELKRFNLEDFRRLSSDPNKALDIMLTKFENFKNESLSVYFDAVKAWRESPLYGLYCKVAIDTLKSGNDMKQHLGDLKKEEWDSLIKLCNSL